MMKFWITGVSLLCTVLASTTASAQPTDRFPSRPVTIVVGFPPGGGGDLAGRWLAEFLRERWNVPVVVENRPGAGGTIAAAHLARTKPDGYTVALASPGPFTVAPHFQKLAYDPSKDFTYLFKFLVSAQPMFVKAESPFKTVQDMMSWAKANPKQLLWSTSATNGTTHIATEAAFRAAGIEATYVPFKGGPDPVNGLLSNQIQVVVTDWFKSFAEAGTIRLLAESGPDKIPAYPGVPTYKELGFPVSLPVFYGMAGPAGMPEDAIRQWEAAGADMVRSPNFPKLVSMLNGTPSHNGHSDFTALVIGAYQQMGRLVPELGLKAPQ
jgi:tripartite-type tricarboxylate transporter receptor subunit TctC